MYAPSARAMKRGVPPTARKARTGELTPPGMTRWARAKSSALFMSGGHAAGRRSCRVPKCASRSVDMARILRRGRGVGVGRRRVGLAGLDLVFHRQRPEEAVGNDVAHAGAKPRVERLVEEGER